jgi:acid stress-induced BolA-like protein IbaG/YrbA
MFEVPRLKQMIEGSIPECTAHVESDDGEHFIATVVAPVFGNLNRVKQHQLVYKAIGAYMGREIHALQLSTLTPSAWAERSGSA